MSEDEEIKRKEYTEQRDFYLQNSYESRDKLDNKLLVLSTGGLTLSIAFIRNVVGSNQIQGKELLIISWVCFMLSVASVLLSFAISSSMFSECVDELDKVYEEGKELNEMKVADSGWLDATNWMSPIFLVIGVILFIVFTSYNLYNSDYTRKPVIQEKIMSTSNSGQENLERGRGVKKPAAPAPQTPVKKPANK